MFQLFHFAYLLNERTEPVEKPTKDMRIILTPPSPADRNGGVQRRSVRFKKEVSFGDNLERASPSEREATFLMVDNPTENKSDNELVPSRADFMVIENQQHDVQTLQRVWKMYKRVQKTDRVRVRENDCVEVNGQRGVVKWKGQIENEDHTILGIEWGFEGMGDSDGSRNGRRYFNAFAERSASFVEYGRATRIDQWETENGDPYLHYIHKCRTGEEFRAAMSRKPKCTIITLYFIIFIFLSSFYLFRSTILNLGWSSLTTFLVGSIMIVMLLITVVIAVHRRKLKDFKRNIRYSDGSFIASVIFTPLVLIVDMATDVGVIIMLWTNGAKYYTFVFFAAFMLFRIVYAVNLYAIRFSIMESISGAMFINLYIEVYNQIQSGKKVDTLRRMKHLEATCEGITAVVIQICFILELNGDSNMDVDSMENGLLIASVCFSYFLVVYSIAEDDWNAFREEQLQLSCFPFACNINQDFFLVFFYRALEVMVRAVIIGLVSYLYDRPEILLVMVLCELAFFYIVWVNGFLFAEFTNIFVAVIVSPKFWLAWIAQANKWYGEADHKERNMCRWLFTAFWYYTFRAVEALILTTIAFRRVKIFDSGNDEDAVRACWILFSISLVLLPLFCVFTCTRFGDNYTGKSNRFSNFVKGNYDPWYAVKNYEWETLEELHREGAIPWHKHDPTGDLKLDLKEYILANDLLPLIIHAECLGMVEYLLTQNPDVNCSNKIKIGLSAPREYNCLHMAILRANSHVINLLIDAKADVNGHTPGIMPAFHLVCRQETADLDLIEQFLADTRVDSNALYMGKHVLHYLCEEAIRIDEEREAEARESRQWTERGRERGSEWSAVLIYKLIQQAQIDPNTENMDGLTPLEYVLKRQSDHYIRILLVDCMFDELNNPQGRINKPREEYILESEEEDNSEITPAPAPLDPVQMTSGRMDRVKNETMLNQIIGPMAREADIEDGPSWSEQDYKQNDDPQVSKSLRRLTITRTIMGRPRHRSHAYDDIENNYVRGEYSSML